MTISLLSRLMRVTTEKLETLLQMRACTARITCRFKLLGRGVQRQHLYQEKCYCLRHQDLDRTKQCIRRQFLRRMKLLKVQIVLEQNYNTTGRMKEVECSLKLRKLSVLVKDHLTVG